MLATRLAGRLVVPARRDARPSRANVRHPAAAQLLTAQPFVLDGLPGTTPRRPRSVAGGGRAFGACCFASKLRSPAGHALAALGWGGLTLRHSLRQPLRDSLRAGVAYPWFCWPSASVLVSPPSWGQSAAKTAADWPSYGGVERPGRKVRFARLIQRRGRVLGGPSARAASGGNLSLTWLPPTVMLDALSLLRTARCGPANVVCVLGRQEVVAIYLLRIGGPSAASRGDHDAGGDPQQRTHADRTSAMQLGRSLELSRGTAGS
jgi:hypothetical protein